MCFLIGVLVSHAVDVTDIVQNVSNGQLHVVNSMSWMSMPKQNGYMWVLITRLNQLLICRGEIGTICSTGIGKTMRVVH